MRMGFAYLNYRLKSKSRHGIHSPFVYNLSEKVLLKTGARKQWEIEALRYELLNDESAFELRDMGAGSRISSGNTRKVKEIAQQSSSPKVLGAMLQRLADYIGAEKIIELGANLGLTTAYLAAAKSAKQVIAIEGDPVMAKKAAGHTCELGLPAKIICGSFEEILPKALVELESVDMAYIDGNHRKEPTLHYFNEILPYTTNDTAIAIGDIHWSSEMEDAWYTLKDHPAVGVTIDLFYVGLVFFRKDQAKEHFILKYK
jgi:predicted O-methyltransferase YrrM